MVSILFVCLANICRSPAAEGIMRELAKQRYPDLDLKVESCGIGDWSLGQLPDQRMREAAKERGVTLCSKAKLWDQSFFDTFDYILCVDEPVRNYLFKLAKTPEEKAKLHLVTAKSKSYSNQPIPDPYFEGDQIFEEVLDMLEDACECWLSDIAEKR